MKPREHRLGRSGGDKDPGNKTAFATDINGPKSKPVRNPPSPIGKLGFTTDIDLFIKKSDTPSSEPCQTTRKACS